MKPEVWKCIGGIWYRTIEAGHLGKRELDLNTLMSFLGALHHGGEAIMPNGTRVQFEAIHADLMALLPVLPVPWHLIQAANDAGQFASLIDIESGQPFSSHEYFQDCAEYVHDCGAATHRADAGAGLRAQWDLACVARRGV